ncbi:MAG: hypothetical protein ACK47B_00060 [Armatimonadota bacterium]
MTATQPRLRRAASRTAGFLARLLATARLEARLAIGSPAPWVVGAILGLLGYIAVRAAPDPASFPIGVTLSQELGPLAGALLLFLAASFAHRPVRYEVTELQDTKRAGSEELLLGRWLGMAAGVLVPLLVEYAVAMAAQKYHSDQPVVPAAYLGSLLRQLPPVLFLTTLSFSLVASTRVLVLGAGLAGLLWFAIFFGESYYPTVLRIQLSQNAPVFLGLTATVLLTMLWGYQGGRRVRGSRVGRLLGAAAVLALCATSLRGVYQSLALPGKHSAVATWQRLRDSRRLPEDPPPNFAWTDIEGRRVSLATLRGEPALVVFFQPKDGELISLLRRLAALRREYAPRGLEVLAVCLSEDLHLARDAARLAGAPLTRELPIVTDWGLPNADGFPMEKPPSVVSRALRIGATPTALLFDPEGREIQRGLPVDAASQDQLKLRLEAVLKGDYSAPPEPEQPENLPGQGEPGRPESGAGDASGSPPQAPAPGEEAPGR